jgi:hypothetical protein
VNHAEVESAGRRQAALGSIAGVQDRLRRTARLRLLVGLLVPVVAYVVLDHVLHNELLALAIVELIPVVWALGYGLARGRLDPIALAAAIVLLAALIVSIADGGSAMPLKLRRGLVTGTLGIACLASVIGGRPLLPYAIRLVEYAWPRSVRLARALRPYTAGRSASVLTVIVGVTLLVDAVAQVTLALTVSTTVFLLTAKLARTAIFVTGLGACWWYASRRAVPDPDYVAGDVADCGDPQIALGIRGARNLPAGLDDAG